MNELNEAFRELNQLCDAHEYTWEITRPPGGRFEVVIIYRRRHCLRNGNDLVAAMREVVKDARRLWNE